MGLDILGDEQMTGDQHRPVLGTERPALHVTADLGVSVEPGRAGDHETSVHIDHRIPFRPEVAVQSAEPDPTAPGNPRVCHRP